MDAIKFPNNSHSFAENISHKSANFSMANQAENAAPKFTLSSESVLELMECLKRHDYHRHLPQLDFYNVPSERQLESFLHPYFTMGTHLDEWAREKGEEISQLRRRIFVESGVREWMDQKKLFSTQQHSSIEAGQLTLNLWRRSLIPVGLAAKNFELIFAQTLLEKLLKKNNHKMTVKSRENLEWMSRRFELELQSGQQILEHSNFLRKYSNYEEYTNLANKMRALLGEVELAEAKVEDINFELPKVRRVIWFVRHSERFDNLLDAEARTKSKADKFFVAYGQNHQLDNSPLSENGQRLADRLHQVFKHIPVRHIFSSPYVRCVETADRLLGDHRVHGLSIKVEPGFLESLAVCGELLSFDGCEELNQMGCFRNPMDCQYRQKVPKRKLVNEFLSRVEGIDSEDEGIPIPLVKYTLSEVLKELNEQKNGPRNGREKVNKMSMKEENMENNSESNKWMAPGEEDAEHIVIVTHGCLGSAMQQLFDGKLANTPQTSIGKLVEIDAELVEEALDQNANDKSDGILKNIRQIFSGATNHLLEAGNEPAKLFKY